LEAPGEVSLRETPAPPPVTQTRRLSRLEIDIRSDALLGADDAGCANAPSCWSAGMTRSAKSRMFQGHAA